MSRRGLLLAGGATILAGCGKDKAAAEPPVTEVLLRSVAAERALGAAIRLDVIVAGLVSEPLPPADRTLLRRIAQRAEDRAGRVAAVLLELSGRSAGSPDRDEPVGDPLERGRAALEANVAALPSLSGRDLRELGAFLVEGSAADLAVLEDVVASASGDAFPGTPA